MRVGCSWKKAACAALIWTVAAHATHRDKHTQDLLGNHNHHHGHHNHDHHHHSHIRGLQSNGEIAQMKCGTPDPSPSENLEVREAIESWMSEKASAAELFGYDEPVQECIPIPTYVFIIQHEDGKIPNKMKGHEKEQIRKMNDDVKGPYNFELEDIIYISNTTWWNIDQRCGESPAEEEMKTELRRGGADTLNVYYINSLAKTGMYGWATFPWDYVKEPKMDGVIVDHDDGFPGSTLVHEVGHWLGLYHTFYGGCVEGADKGDQVEDTPAQRDATTEKCTEEGRDSCPNLPGKDPIENFMDYSDCGKEFSPGQYARIQAMWQIYRSPSRSPLTGSPTESNWPTRYPHTSSPAVYPTTSPTTASPTTSHQPSIEKLTRCSDNAPTSAAPSIEPTDEPSTSYEPTALAKTTEPTADPTPKQMTEPTANPTPKQTTEPTANPTPKQTTEPTANPTPKQTTDPTAEPTTGRTPSTTEPTPKPTPEQMTEPTAKPTAEPTTGSTNGPTPEPTTEATREPTPEPTGKTGKGRKIGNGDKTGKGRKTSKGVKTGKGVKSDSRASGKGDKAHKGGKEANTVKVLGENI